MESPEKQFLAEALKSGTIGKCAWAEKNLLEVGRKYGNLILRDCIGSLFPYSLLRTSGESRHPCQLFLAFLTAVIACVRLKLLVLIVATVRMITITHPHRGV